MIVIDRPIVYVDTSSVREGKLPELRAAMADLAGFVHENMPRLQSYGFFLDQTGSHMSVVAVHPDAGSLAFHLETGAERFRSFGSLIELQAIDVYGEVPEAVTVLLDRKASALGGAVVRVHRAQAGFAR